MTGFWALAWKEVLEQRRTWKFLALVGIFTAVSLLVAIIPFAITEVKGESQGAEEARQLFQGYGITIFTLGTLVTIIVAMGSLSVERASGTAAMTLSKPVTRAAFVGAKFLGLALSIFTALVVGSAVMYVLTIILFDYWSVARFAAFMAIIGVYLIFIASITFFWSGMFRRQLLAGGLALLLFIVQGAVSEIPHTQRYWPINAPEWGAGITDVDEGVQQGGYWTSFAISWASIAVLGVGTWAVFRRKEL